VSAPDEPSSPKVSLRLTEITSTWPANVTSL